MNIDKALNKLDKRHPLKRAIVTGAASGAGQAIAQRLLARGWALCLIDCDPKIKQQQWPGALCELHTVDVVDCDAVSEIIGAYAAKNAGVDMLFNSAGIAAAGTFKDFPIDAWRRVIDVNLLGVVYPTHATLPHLSGAGQIVNLISAAAFHNLPRLGAYNAAKAGLLAHSETLAAELAGSRQQVLPVMMSFYRSNIAEHTLGKPEDCAAGARMMEASSRDSEWAADQILIAAGQGRRSLITPVDAKFIWILKRISPSFYARVSIWIGNLIARRMYQ